MIIYRAVLAAACGLFVGIHFNSPALFMGIYLGLMSLIVAEKP